MKRVGEIYKECENCEYKYVSYGEPDIGYEEWSCELLEQYSCSQNNEKHNAICPCFGDEDNYCPLTVKYITEE